MRRVCVGDQLAAARLRASRPLRIGLASTPAMASQARKALAEMTMDTVSKDPERAEELKAPGFQMLWAR